jgi:tryptophan synthase alpha subunit
MRDQIVEESIDALRMTAGSKPLYDGLLIEAGNSDTDTDQHITIPELAELVDQIQKYREVRTREPHNFYHKRT